MYLCAFDDRWKPINWSIYMLSLLWSRLPVLNDFLLVPMKSCTPSHYFQ